MEIPYDDFISIIKPSSFPSVHNANRVIILDAIVNALIDFHNINEEYNHCRIIERTRKTLVDGVMSLSGYGRRYQFHGGVAGCFDGFFSNTDRYLRYVTNGGKMQNIDSIPQWNIAHYFCDYLDDSKAELFVRWLDGDNARLSNALNLISNLFANDVFFSK